METGHIVEVTAQTTAAVAGRANAQNIVQIMMPLLTEVWNFLRSSGPDVPTHLGQNVVVYHEGGSFLSDEGIPIEAAVLVKAPFPNAGRIVISTTPAGRAATLTHIGPYQKLGEAHKALRGWCEQNGHTPAGTSWEVYGHWTSDENALQTDIFYLLN